MTSDKSIVVQASACTTWRRLKPALQGAAALAGVVFALASSVSAADGQVLANLRKEHPRLYVLDADLPRVRELVRTDALAREWHEKLTAQAVKMLDEPPVQRVLKGPRLLGESRSALKRIGTLTGLYRLDGDKRFADRAVKEMLAVAQFADWNPSHFLDVAEMTNAMAIGYDWLHAYMSDEQRGIVRKAIVEKGLKPGLDGFEKGAWWTKAKHNWSQVCNGGLTAGALAVADEEPEIAAKLIPLCREAIRPAMNAFAPDGGCAEGPGYWDYATTYAVYYLSALQTGLGTDFGIGRSEGFDLAGFFHIHSCGPVGKTFNYADAGSGIGATEQLFWMARAYQQPAYAAWERAKRPRDLGILHLLWFDGSGDEKTIRAMPKDACFRGVNVAFFRSGWLDPEALFLGFKGGDNKANHSHLDLGTFVLDALGQRWAVDLGGDDYNLPGYFGKDRWTYYRLRTEGHNTLVIDGENQATDGKAPIVAFRSADALAYAVADMSSGYRTAATSVLRGVALHDRSIVLVQDEVKAGKPVEVVWQMHTPAKVAIDGTTATLSLGGKTLTARLLSPAGAKFDTASANPPPPQGQQPDVSKLLVRLPDKTADVRIAVLLSIDANKKSPALRPLAQWVSQAK